MVREVWCKHASDKFVQYCKVNGIDITAEGYDPFIANTFRTENGVGIKSILGDANQLLETWRSDNPKISPLDDVAYIHKEPTSTDAFDSSSINQLKEKMDNEGTYSVTDALSGKALKPRK